MFMTPREIVNKYQVLDADREEVDNWDEGNPDMDWRRTGRPERTSGAANIHNPDRSSRYSHIPGSGPYLREPSVDYSQETDEQVLSRKAEEAPYDPEYYAEMRGENFSGAMRSFNPESALGRSSAPGHFGLGGSTNRNWSDTEWDEHEMRVDSYLSRKQDEHYRRQAEAPEPPSLYESIQEGGVQHPVHLGTQFGSQGKPQIVGGHHRIAAALETRPDDLIPVLHHEDIYDAKASRGYKYGNATPCLMPLLQNPPAHPRRPQGHAADPGDPGVHHRGAHHHARRGRAPEDGPGLRPGLGGLRRKA